MSAVLEYIAFLTLKLGFCFLGTSPAGILNNTVTLVNIVQYILVRRDLISQQEWPAGAIIAQACHASSAAIHLFYNDPVTQAYLKDLDNMHKIVLEVLKSIY